MNANEKIYIRHYDATTTEDVFDKGEIEKWKRGEMRLWDCTLNVYLGVCAERDLTESEVMA